MQQTQKYKLNLIESSDPFLPEALNQNTLKLEQVVSQHLEGMDQRVTLLEASKFAYGHYTGVYHQGEEDAGRFIPLPFTPKFVIIFFEINNPMLMLVVDGVAHHQDVWLAEGGFYVRNSFNSSSKAFLAFV